jgi:hypothetical protein
MLQVLLIIFARKNHYVNHIKNTHTSFMARNVTSFPAKDQYTNIDDDKCSLVVGMTYGACQGPSYLPPGVPGVSTALG